MRDHSVFFLVYEKIMSTSDYEEEKPRGKRKANAKQTSYKNRMDGVGGK